MSGVLRKLFAPPDFPDCRNRRLEALTWLLPDGPVMRGARRIERPDRRAMKIVPTHVGPSKIEGVGIFAAAQIRSGDPIWVLEERFDLLLPVGELATLPALQRQFIERYGYPHMTRPGIIVLDSTMAAS